MTPSTLQRAEQALTRLERLVRSQGYRGWDPYDALNSDLLRRVTSFHPFAQRVAIHVFKLLPWNFRGVLGIQQSCNPTALSLFIDSYLNLFRVWGGPSHLAAAQELFGILRGMTCVDNEEELGWGRNFTFVAQTERHETSKPLTFLNAKIGRTMLNLFEVTGDAALLRDVEKMIATILRQGKVFRVQGRTFLGYSADSQPRLILNASVLSAALFLNYLRLSGRADCVVEGESLRELAHQLTDTALGMQNADGSWPYGLTFAGQRIENVDFHQGFVIDSLLEMQDGLAGETRDAAGAAYRRGLAFLAREQIDPEGAFKWRYPRKYPIDIHNQAQGIISLSRAPGGEQDERLESVLRFTLDHFWDESDGYFYYQKYPLFTNKISYLRWSQGWMTFALSELLKNKV